MKRWWMIFLLGLTPVLAHAEFVGIDAVRIFREHSFRGLETKCTEEKGNGCKAVQVYFQGQAITRPLTERDFYLDTNDYGRTLEITFSDRVSCRGGELLEARAKSHVHIRNCVNRNTPILIGGNPFLFLNGPGPMAVEYNPGKRDDFKRDLRRLDLTYTYMRAIMFRDHEILSSETAARRIAEYLQQSYAP